MPNILVHYTFAKENVLDPGPFLEATYVGAQGPDPFFYFGVLPFRKRPFKKVVPSLGGITQHLELTEPYNAFIEYAKKSPDKELLFAYIDGLFMHYAVDRACHPYIFFNTGFTDRPEDPIEVQRHYNFGHLYMENYLDFIVAKREKTFTRPDKVLRLKKRDLQAISLMWYTVNQEVQHVPHIEKNTFLLCLHDYRSTMKVAWDPLHYKKGLFKKIFGKESFPYGIVYPKDLKGFETCDFLNEKHTTWRMPAGEKKNESFDDLLREAAVTYSSLHEALMEAKKGANVKDSLTAIGQHLNHEGIIPGSPKIYWKLIWPETFLKDVVAPPKD